MDEVKNTAVSRLKISEDVILTVAKLAALEVKGVAGLDGEMSIMNKLKNNLPMKVSSIGDVVAVEIRIKINGDAKAVSVAQAVQNAVKEDVQDMTGITVARVNVIIGGAVFS